ncbi:MAG TPA: alpha-amylase family protein [Polyangia bacterium]|nr:alpha-amylase family protein [Polyangia bacterium]
MRRVGPAAATLALTLVACGSGSVSPDAVSPGAASSDAGADASVEAPTVVHLGPPAPGAVFVHLFEWRWTDVARECEAYLGPAGFAAVQVSPPSEHAVLPGYPWWQRYQTVGYELDESRSGTADEFRDMVRRCAAAGVAIYVDAVVNHMTAQASGTGSHGTRFTKYDYPGTYAATDFHMPPCTIADADYASAPDRVRRCELLGLADLDTGAEAVRARIAGYLAALVELGVAGFRIDAAKHIAPADLDAILNEVSAAVGPEARPFYYLEVVDHGGEAIHASDYLPVGQGAAAAVDVIEFKYQAIADAFAGLGAGSVAGLPAAGADWLPSERAVVFVNNHDTQRASSLYYQDAPSYDLATVFLLAWPYGYPQILSSFAFDRTTQAGRDQGPPSDAAGHTRPVYAAGSSTPDCKDDLSLPAQPAGQWLCEHRRPFIARMIAFRKAAAGVAVTDEWDDGADALAFGRGARGFVVINAGASTLRRTFATSLPAGAYCDVYGGAPTATGCSGATFTVGADGATDLSVAAGAAVVLQEGMNP